MRKVLIILVAICFIVFTGYGFVNAGVTDEAKVKIEKEKHEELVPIAKKLLERKEYLENALADVNKKLKKVDEGEAVELPSENCYLRAFTTNGNVLSYSYSK